jgi:cytochrome c peroxidase
MVTLRRISILVCIPIALGLAGCAGEEIGSDFVRGEQGLAPPHFLPNNFPVKNEHGFAASFSTAGTVDLAGAFFTPQGTNGRHCGSCHAVADGWSMSAATVQARFNESAGLDPLFNLLDADRPDAFASMDALRAATVDERRAAFTMLLQGKFTRLITLPASRQYEVVSFHDPFGVSTASRVFFFRRAMPTANFGSGAINWDNSNGAGGDLHAGLANQARGNIRGAQQGTAVEEVVQEIVAYEKAISHAQLILGDVRLDSDGALGGPENRSAQPLVDGRFTLFDAWVGSRDPLKAQVARGQALFNDAKPGRGSCRGCHNAANDGQNVAGALFNIGSSRCDFARPDMATFVLRNSATGEERCSTDAGRAFRSGAWGDVDRFDVPSLRGVGSRGGYLHNGLARTLTEVVEHYERALNFSFTAAERADLVTFLQAL